MLRNPDGGIGLAFQRVAELPRTTWPRPGVPQQLHLDLTVPDIAALDAEHERVLGLGRHPAGRLPAARPGGAAAGLRRPGRSPVLHLRRLSGLVGNLIGHPIGQVAAAGRGLG